jgi:hypothetical protein
MNRSLSIRSRKGHDADTTTSPKHRFTMSSLRDMKPGGHPELSKKMNKLIKSENHAISAYDQAGRERVSIASQLSEWGESTGDDAISEISDKLGVLLAEIAEQEDVFAQGLEEYRGVLKQIRNTESSVQPSRDHKAKISDDLSKLKYKEPASTKIQSLEQELVRAEAQSLVAEAQLTNITRQKFLEAYTVHLAALLERSEKQALLAKQAQRLLLLLDDTPVVPGEERKAFARGEEARLVLGDAEAELRAWTPSWEQHDAASTGLNDGSTEHESFSSPSAITTAPTSDGTHLAAATTAPLPEQHHADLYHDPATESAGTGVSSGHDGVGDTEAIVRAEERAI